MTAAINATGDPVGAAHARLLADRTLQFDFTDAPTIAPPTVPNWLHELSKLIQALAPAMKYVFWGGLAVVAALVVWFIARELIALHWRRRPRKAKAAAAVTDWRPSADQAQGLLDDADRLAAQGKYAEAAHLLLLRTIDDIKGRRPDLVRPALTSRDIGALQALPDTARPAFAFIARLVEGSLFGGRPVDADAFGQARQAYAAFALPADFAVVRSRR
jgi:hypothetical protein